MKKPDHAAVLAHGKDGKAGGGKKGKHKVVGMHVRKGASGGYIARHETEDKEGMPGPSPEHVMPDMAALHDHMDQHMGDGSGGGNEEEEEAENEGAPQQQPGGTA